MKRIPITRREFLQYASAGAAGVLLDPWLISSSVEAASLQGTGLSLPCCAGDVSADGAIIWLRTDGARSVALEYAKTADFQGALRTASLVTRGDNDFTAKIVLGRLEPATHYFYRAVVAEHKPGPVARLVTAPRADASASFRFAFSGDTRQNHQPFTVPFWEG